jgi:AcrR family transcriptional regulator
MTAPQTTRRERARLATMSEIKATALDLMHQQGHTDVRFTDIARAMGLTPPALYRYYGDRDELLTDLITDAYRHLAAALALEVAAAEPADPAGRLLRVAGAYRRWVLEEPQQFALIFGPPVPGYAAPEGGATVEAANDAMANLAAVVEQAAGRGELGDPIVSTVDASTVACMIEQEKAAKLGADLSPATHQAMMHAWAALHGFVCLEAYGHLDHFPPQARDGLFRAQVELAGRAIGLWPQSSR